MPCTRVSAAYELQQDSSNQKGNDLHMKNQFFFVSFSCFSDEIFHLSSDRVILNPFDFLQRSHVRTVINCFLAEIGRSSPKNC